MGEDAAVRGCSKARTCGWCRVRMQTRRSSALPRSAAGLAGLPAFVARCTQVGTPLGYEAAGTAACSESHQQ